MKLTTTLLSFLIVTTIAFSQNFDFEADKTNGCAPQKVIFLNKTDESIRNNYTYQWTVEKGKFSQQIDSVQNTYIKSGTYDVTLKVFDKAGNNLIETITKPNYITIYNDPNVIIQSNKDSTCQDKPFQFSVKDIQSDTAIVSYTWVLSDGTIYYEETPPPHIFYDKNKFEIFLSVQDGHGCTNRERESIFVKTTADYPDIQFTADKRKTCDEQLNVTFTNQTNDKNVVSFHWDFGDEKTFDGKTPPKHLYKGYGRYYAMLSAVSKSECENTVAQTIQLIDYKPTISITDKSPEVVFDIDNYGKYIEQDSLSTCPCKQAHGGKEIDYKIITASNKACIGPITFTDSTPSNDNIKWEWTLEKKDEATNKKTVIATSTDRSFTEDITEGGMYIITMKSDNGVCTDETSRIFYVEPPLEITIEPETGFYCENPALVEYKANSNIPGTNFLWLFGGSNMLYLGDSYTATYKNNGLYQNKVYAISPNSCRYSEVTSKNIEITRPVLNASRYISETQPLSTTFNDKPVSGCKPLDVDFDVYYWYHTDQDSIKSITWNFDDKGKSTSVTTLDKKEKDGHNVTQFTYVDTGVYRPRVALETYKGCNIEISALSHQMIKVGEVPDVSISYDKTEMCANDELTISLTFNDGAKRYTSIYDTVEVTFVSEKKREMSVPRIPMEESFTAVFRDTLGVQTSRYFISDNGCRVEVEDNHQLMLNGPLITIGLSETDCDNPYNYKAYFSKKMGVTSWEWYIKRDKTVFPIPEQEDTIYIDFHDYGGRGEYKIYVDAHNSETGCDMSDTVFIQVTDIKGDFEMKHNIYCLNSSVDFIVGHEMGQDISQWKWFYNWNDSTASAVFAIFQKANGITRFDQPYTTTEIDDCGNISYIEHLPDPSMLFTIDTNNIEYVTVVASDIHGCTDTVSKPIQIVAPKAVFDCDVTEDCLPYTATLTDTSTSVSIIKQREWYIDGVLINRENKKSVSSTIETPGFKDVTLIVTDDFGCTDTTTKTNYIKPTVPNTFFYVDHPKLCLGVDASFTRNLNVFGYKDELTHYKWEYGDGTVEEKDGNLAQKTPYSYPKASKNTFDVKLVGYTQSPEGHECVDSTTQIIDVKNVSSTIKIKSSDLCKEPGQKFIIYLDNSIYNSNIKQFDWWKVDAGDSIYISKKRTLQAVTFDNYGDQMLCLRTKSDYYGCEDTTTKLPVHVPGYDATLIIDKDSACIRENIHLTLLDTLNLYRYNSYWEFGDGNSRTLTGNTEDYGYTSLAVTEDNTYKIQFIVNAEGCKPRDISANVTIFPVIADFTRGITDMDTAGCPPYTVTLYNKSVANESASYLWEIGNETTTTENPILTIPNLNTVIPVTLTVTSNICNDKITKNVSTYPAANISVDMDSIICFGEKIHAKATGDFTSIQWEPRDLFTNSKNAVTDISVKESQYIYMNTLSGHNCKNTDSIFVYVQQKPYYLGAPNKTLLFYDSNDSLIPASRKTNNLIAGQIYNLNVEAIPGVNYAWSPSDFLSCIDCTSPDITLLCGDDSGTDCLGLPDHLDYKVTMSDTLGCFANDTTLHFNIVFDTKIALPEAFSPNEDGKNDIAYVRGWGIREFVEVKIFNRWGQVVFESNDMAKGWDGTFHGKPQSIDTYAYTIKAIDMEGKDIFVKGYITLLR